MTRLLATLLLGLTLLTIPTRAASVWNAVADRLTGSVLFLEAVGPDGSTLGSCSGFVIHSEKRYVLTAAHCDADKIRADGMPSYKMYKDERKDLLVLRVATLDTRPSFKLAKEDPKIGDQIASIGYGFGLEEPMFRIGHISNVRLDFDGLSGPFVLIDNEFIGGQSGGPVINEAGEVVAIVQRGGSGLGLGVGASIIKDRVGRYFDN